MAQNRFQVPTLCLYIFKRYNFRRSLAPGACCPLEGVKVTPRHVSGKDTPPFVRTSREERHGSTVFCPSPGCYQNLEETCYP